MIEHRHLAGSQGERRRIGQRRAQSHLFGGLHDFGAPGRGISEADDDRELDRNGIDRLRERTRQCHSPAIGMSVIFRAPVADADRCVIDDRGRFHAAGECRGIDIRLE
jgi:hypothetical protein